MELFKLVFRSLWAIVILFSLSLITLFSPFHQFTTSIVSQNPLIGRARGKGMGAVFSTWKGLNVIRAYNPTPQQSNTTAQLDQRQKFSVIQSMMSKCLLFVRKGFELFQDGQTAFNEAMSRNILGAITGAYPNYAVDYPSVQLSDGTLIDLGTVAAADGGGALATVTWDRIAASGNGSVNDTINVIVFNPSKPFAISDFSSALRSAGIREIQCPADWVGDSIYLYIFATSELSGTVKSPSQYAGTLILGV